MEVVNKALSYLKPNWGLSLFVGVVAVIIFWYVNTWQDEDNEPSSVIVKSIGAGVIMGAFTFILLYVRSLDISQSFSGGSVYEPVISADGFPMSFSQM